MYAAVTKYVSPLISPLESAHKFQGQIMFALLIRLWYAEDGQDIAEYAMMFAVVLAMVMSVARAIGSHASAVFSRIASSIH